MIISYNWKLNDTVTLIIFPGNQTNLEYFLRDFFKSLPKKQKPQIFTVKSLFSTSVISNLRAMS